MLVFQPVSEDPRKNSLVYKNTVSWRGLKMYWGLSQEDILRYAILQNANSGFRVTLEEDRNYAGRNFNVIEIQVLRIPEDSYEACDIRKKGKVLVTEPDFVEWESLSELFEQEEYLIQNIATFFQQVYADLSIYGPVLLIENAKITGVEWWVLTIVVTDITNNIKRLVERNKGLLDAVLEVRRAKHEDI